MDTGFQHTHTLVVVLFLIQFIVKVVLLFSNKSEMLEKISAKTKILQMVLGALIIVTGGYLLFKSPNAGSIWMIIKLVLVFSAIPMGIVGLKKSNKALSAVSLALFLYVFLLAMQKDVMLRSQSALIDEQTSEIGNGGSSDENAAKDKGVAIYTVKCQNCHGENGSAGFQGAKPLPQSELNEQQMIEIVKNGQGVMPGNADLSNEDITAVVKYIRTLGKE